MEQIKIKSELRFRLFHALKGETYKVTYLYNINKKSTSGRYILNRGNRFAYVSLV